MDKVIFISGDGDFADLLRRIKNRKKEIEICYFTGCISKTLLKEADSKKVIDKKTVNKFFLRENRKQKELKLNGKHQNP
ncbi:MAG: NYN domain-containing protein [Nanoarchaeota archaeon]|nr:NYN domain-containing protein [Nanoarchaeota archaeon]